MCIPRQSGDGRRQAVRQVPWAESTHAGLWLDRYLRVLNPGDNDADKQAIRDLITKAAGTAVPLGYDAALQRREAMLRGLDGGLEGGETLICTAKVLGRMVVGLGTESLRETNLTLEHTWGVPVIPGSALKGVAAAAAHTYGGPTWRQAVEKAPIGDDHRLLFGDTTSKGFVTFHDAWWIPSGATLPLDLDIMTVHHAGYYGGKADPPADWDEPNPVAFMTATGTYLVALTGPSDWVERAANWLNLALEQHGVGGKTRAGYGRMKLERKLTEDELDLEARMRHVRELPARHRGAQTAREHLDALWEEHKDGVLDLRSIQEAGRALWQADPRFWKDWRRRQDDERKAQMQAVGLWTAGEEPVPAPTPAPAGGQDGMSPELAAALTRLAELRTPNKLGKLVGQVKKTLTDDDMRVFAGMVVAWCEANGCSEQLEKLKDLKGYLPKE